jgi:hypothetical protein
MLKVKVELYTDGSNIYCSINTDNVSNKKELNNNSLYLTVTVL